MLADLLKKNIQAKAIEEENKKNAANTALDKIKKKEAQVLALFFEAVKRELNAKILAGAVDHELDLNFAASSTQTCEDFTLSSLAKDWTKYSWYFDTFFETDAIFAPVFNEFKTWCESEGLTVKWVDRENSGLFEENEACWALSFSIK